MASPNVTVIQEIAKPTLESIAQQRIHGWKDSAALFERLLVSSKNRDLAAAMRWCMIGENDEFNQQLEITCQFGYIFLFVTKNVPTNVYFLTIFANTPPQQMVQILKQRHTHVKPFHMRLSPLCRAYGNDDVILPFDVDLGELCGESIEQIDIRTGTIIG